ncbi:hypothetical protein G9U51_08395 [Calidifontibacter sp. DB0510]|uniref:Uncharacterized protein n=1 Tax=Metallococcus carri TaxID=1656884 RepID=A0A967B1Y0_9MICO|nr:hypothetical protein [Metallococcus carri]NHN55795.1 hypothetical protein [Metallococcus carri]NOP38516.1 hypothetical protein [Calidifontibacter sp. DB2511S]
MNIGEANAAAVVLSKAKHLLVSDDEILAGGLLAQKASHTLRVQIHPDLVAMAERVHASRKNAKRARS